MNYLEIAQAHVAEQYPLVAYHTPPLSMLPKGAILGTWSYSIPGKVRFILDKQRELAPGVLPADVSRAWIRDVYALPLRRRKSQLNRHYVLPLLAQKGEWGDCAYVDIKGAYLNVLRMGYDLEYSPGRYLAVDPKPIPDIIEKNKFCYSIAIAMSASKMSNISIMGNEGVFTQNKFNTFSNPCLYAFACDLLSSVASEAMALLGREIVYINTDGYILPTKYAHYLIDIIESWGLRATVKAQGDTQVFGVGSWKVGTEQTTRHDPNGKSFQTKLPEASERRFLKRSFTRLIKNCDILLTE